MALRPDPVREGESMNHPNSPLTPGEMDVEEIRRVVEQSSRKLFQISSPPVRYWLLTQVMGADKDDAVLRRTLQECSEYPPRLRLLGKLRPDGTWPIPKHRKHVEDAGPGPPVGFTYRTILWNLFTLAEYKTTREEGHVSAALANIMKWQADEGYILGPWTDAFPLPYYNGHALHLLLRFGLEKNPSTQRMIKWLLSQQRADGGWNIPYVMDLYYLPEYRGMRMRDFIESIRNSDKSEFDLTKFHDVPSCIWSTVLVIWGMTESPNLAKSRAVMAGADFFLNRFFKKNYHSAYYMSDDHWTKLRWPVRFGNGLMALDLLARLGYGPDDPRMEKPINWLLGARAHDSIWSQAQRPHPEKDQWISLMALRTLHRFAALA